MGDKKSFVVYIDWMDKLSGLSDEDFGKLFRAVFQYVSTGEKPDCTPMVNLAFGFMKDVLDADQEKYKAKCTRNASNISRRWQRGGSASNSNDIPNQSTGIPNDTTSIPLNTNRIPTDTTGIPSDTTDIPNDTTEYQTPVITDNCKLITDNCVSTNVDTITCAEQQASSTQEAVIKLQLNDGTYYSVLKTDADRWRELYPAVDVEQELRKIAGWIESNPKRRKTRRGIRSFVNSWLSKAQDKGGRSPDLDIKSENKTVHYHEGDGIF